MKAVLIASVAAILLACGCSGASDDTSEVSRTSFESAGEVWPLSVESGNVGCSGMAAWIDIDGVRYGLNGYATSAAGYTEIKPIWLVNEAIMGQYTPEERAQLPTMRISLAPLIQMALKKCES